MDKQIIISISREYGSGGHEIAEKLRSSLDSSSTTGVCWMKLRKQKYSDRIS